jgi:hypothetical protein
MDSKDKNRKWITKTGLLTPPACSPKVLFCFALQKNKNSVG